MMEDVKITTITGRTINCGKQMELSEILREKSKKVIPVSNGNTKIEIKESKKFQNYKFSEQFPGVSDHDLKKIVFDFMKNSDSYKVFVQIFEEAHGQSVITNRVVNQKTVQSRSYKMGVDAVKAIIAKQKATGMPLPILLLRLKKKEELKKLERLQALNKNVVSEPKQFVKTK